MLLRGLPVAQQLSLFLKARKCSPRPAAKLGRSALTALGSPVRPPMPSNLGRCAQMHHLHHQCPASPDQSRRFLISAIAIHRRSPPSSRSFPRFRTAYCVFCADVISSTSILSRASLLADVAISGAVGRRRRILASGRGDFGAADGERGRKKGQLLMPDARDAGATQREPSLDCNPPQRLEVLLGCL